MTAASLNHVYRLVWNEVSQSFVAVSEHTRGRSKRSRRGAVAAVVLSLGALAGAHAQQAPPAGALPTQGQIVGGQGQIQSGAQQTTIRQDSSRLLINWGSFNIGADARMQFVQPGRDSVALNRVTGGGVSTILGQLSGNGQVWLLNPAGIVFGHSAQVDVGGLVASTLSLSDADFLAGRHQFSGATSGRVENHGRLTADGGYIALLGTQVHNTGTIQTPQGHTALAAGNGITLSLGADDLIGVRVDQAAVNALVQHSGSILADGGVVTLSARGAQALMNEVINTSGVIEARGLSAHGGRIVLDGGPEEGMVRVSGRLDASAAQGVGGDIAITGRHIRLEGDGTVLNASGRDGGGQIHVGGGYQGRDARYANATTVDVAAGVQAEARATGVGDGGQVVFWSDDRTRFAGQIDIRGGDQGGNGGLAEVSGLKHLSYQGRTDATAAQGRTGDLLLDPATISIQVGSATGDISGDAVTVADLEAQNANVLLQATGNITFGDLSLNGGDGRLSMANNVSLRVEAGTNGSGSINFQNINNTIEVFGTGSIMMVAGSTGSGQINNVANLIAHGSGTNPGTLPTHNVTSVGSGTPGAGSVTLFGADGLTIGGAITTNGGYVRLWGDSDNASGGGLTLSSPIITNGGNLYLSTGTSPVNLNSDMTLGTGRIFFRADGSHTSGTKVLGGTLRASGDVDVDTNFQMNAGASILTDGVIRLSSTVNLNTGAGVLTLRGSSIDFTGATLQNLSTASIRLEPADASVNMVLGDASGFASASTLAALPGILNLTIGRTDGTGTISVPTGGFSFDASGTLELVNNTVTIGTVGNSAATLVNTTGNITITSDNINVVQAVTANGGAGKVTLRQQTAANELRLGSGLSNSSVGQINAATLAVGRADGGNLVFDSDITTTATSVHLLSGQRVEGVNGGVSAANLAVTAGGGATISDSAFDFTTLAASLGGSTDSSITSSSASWGLGTVDGVSGLTRQSGATGAATLTASDTLTLNAPINFNNTATTLNLRANTIAAASATVSNQALATVTLDRASVGPLTVGGTAGAIQQASLARFNNVSQIIVGDTSRALEVVGNVSVAVGNRLTLQGQTVTGISGSNTLATTAGSMKVEAATGGLALNANVTAASTLILTEGDGSGISGSGTLTANQVALRTSGTADLDDSTHQVSTLAAQVGSLSLRNGRALTVDTVDSLQGVVATDTVDVRTSGASSDITLNQAVSAGNISQAEVGALLASSRHFINNAGSTGVQSSNGAWRVYSTTPTSDTRGGLVADFKQYNATTASTVLGTGDGMLYSVAPTLTAGLTGSTSKTYDATTTASLVAGNFTLSGAIDGDTVDLDLAGMGATYDTKNVGTGKTVTATGLALDAASNGATTVYGYQLASTSANGAIGSITRRSIAVGDLSASNKVYDGNTTASLGLGNAILGSDVVTLSGSGQFDTKHVGTGKAVTVTGLGLAGGDAGNYELAATSGTLSAGITPKQLTVGSATVANKVYDGNTTASVSGVALTGVVGGDDVGTTASGTFDNKNAGTGKTVTVSGVTLTGGDAGNYTLSTTLSTGQADIGRKTLTVGSTTIASKTFDGTRSAQVTGIGLDGVVEGDTVQAGGQGEFANLTVGRDKLVLVSSITLSGVDANNYALASTGADGRADINAAPNSPGVTALTSDASGSNGTATTPSTGGAGGNEAGNAVRGTTQSSALPIEVASAGAGTGSTTQPGGGASTGLEGGRGTSTAMALDLGSVLSSQGTVSLTLVGQASQPPVSSPMPVFRSSGASGANVQSVGQYLVTDAGDSLVLAPAGSASPMRPDMSQAVTRSGQSTIPVGNGLSATLQVAVLADGTLAISVPPEAAVLPDDAVSAMGLTVAKLELGVSVRDIRAVVLTPVNAEAQAAQDPDR